MSDLITVKAKTKAGHIQDFQVAQIISIDGLPYEGAAVNVRDSLMHLDGRLSVLEQALGSLVAAAGGISDG